MDRDMLFAVMVAVFGTAIAGAFYFGDSPQSRPLAPETDTAVMEERVYEPNDIRYRVQQEELRKRAREKKRKLLQAATTPAPSDDSSSVDEGSIDDTSVTDHAPVGEPDIE